MSRLKVGIVGLRRGRTHLRNFLKLEQAEVVGAADRFEQCREAAQKQVMEALRNHFRPEFLNRVDEVILFNHLTKRNLKKIVDIQIRDLERILADRKITIELAEEVKELLAEEGFDNTYGARPLKRLIQHKIQDALAMQLLEGKFKEGDHIRVTKQNGELVFEKR